MVSLRRARPDDADWLAELLSGEETEPFLSPNRAFDREAALAEIERSDSEPETFGRFVVEADGQRAGVLGFEERSSVHRIAHRQAGVRQQPAKLDRCFLGVMHRQIRKAANIDRVHVAVEIVERERRNTEFVGPVRLQQIDRFARIAFVQCHESPQGRYIGRLNLRVFRVFFVELVRESFGFYCLAPQC